MDNFWGIFGIFVLIAGLLDAWKQKYLVYKIKRFKSSKGVSRQFINFGIVHKILLSIYAIGYLKNYVVSLASLLALYTTLELWYYCYIFYPFLGKGRFGYQRPSILKYIWNSILPNKFSGRI